MSRTCPVVFYQGDFGKRIGGNFVQPDCDCPPGESTPIDISDADSTSIVFKKPSGATTTLVGDWADFPSSDGTPAAGDGTDGRMMVTITSAAFFDEVGVWEYQAIATKAGEYEHATDVGVFRVSARLA